MIQACLGMDTSCYTTSVALSRIPGEAAGVSFWQARRLLSVPQGQRGLMQSEGVFQHVSRLPDLLRELLSGHPDMAIAAVCASVRPRPAGDSYMPVFRAGEGFARAVAAALRVPFYETTHQEGHLASARVDTALCADTPHLALHLSGGTTEVLTVRGSDVALLGGSRDLHAGQLIDRVGVTMGLPFPAGPHLEKLAMRGSDASRLSAALRGMDCHFSGAEAQALRWLDAGEISHEDIAAEVFGCVSRTVARLIVRGCEAAGVADVLLGGGVASSTLLKKDILERVCRRNRALRLHFARPDLSGDNAVGVALIGAERYRTEEEGACRQQS